jgi:hypothetical protein
MILDVQALSLGKLALKPCVCGSHSLYLDDRMEWQCSRCTPEGDADTIRMKLDQQSSPKSESPTRH